MFVTPTYVVELHHNVSTNGMLDRHTFLGLRRRSEPGVLEARGGATYCKHSWLAVERALEQCTLLRDLSKLVERYQLEATAVLSTTIALAVQCQHTRG